MKKNMGKFRLLIRLATIAGPSVLRVVRHYGPQLRTMVNENPQLLEQIKGKIKPLAIARSKETKTQEYKESLEVLRQQVTYLFASANDSVMAAKTRNWRNEIDSLEKSLPLYATMSASVRRKELKILQQRIDTLSAAIVDVTISNVIEDAQIVEKATDNSNKTGY